VYDKMMAGCILLALFDVLRELKLVKLGSSTQHKDKHMRIPRTLVLKVSPSHRQLKNFKYLVTRRR
jgi:hypothetical protein